MKVIEISEQDVGKIGKKHAILKGREQLEKK